MGLEEADPIQDHGIYPGTKNKQGFSLLQMGYTTGLIFHYIFSKEILVALMDLWLLLSWPKEQ